MKRKILRAKVAVKTEMQKRAENLKSLEEKRAALVQEMKDITENAEKEVRALTKEENESFDKLEEEVKEIDKTIEKAEHARNIKLTQKTDGNPEEDDDDDAEVRAFENYIRKEMGMPMLEQRAGEQNLTMGGNGAIIPTTIANRIITEVKDMCPIFAKATLYAVKGTLKVPVWGKANETHKITVGYQEEFTEITADNGKFTSVDLTGYLAGALALLGKSVLNNSNIDVVSFIVTEMAKEIALFLERELLIGTEDYAEGALSTTTSMTAAATAALTADEIIKLQTMVKQVYQKNACWTMHPDTFTAVKLLKDANGRYLLQDDITGEFPYRMLGKPVYLSDNMPTMAAGNKAILYGDYSGLSVNMRENVEIQILMEKYATQHAIGIVGWFEFDSKVTDHQKLATLQMKAAS